MARSRIRPLFSSRRLRVFWSSRSSWLIERDDRPIIVRAGRLGINVWL